MIKNWLENGVFLYVMTGICAVGILLRMVLAQYYNHFLKNTAKWMETEKGWLSKVRREYEQCIEKQGKLHNVDIFVDKCVGTKKIMGIMLSTWNKIGGQAWILCVGVLAATVISGIFYQVDKELLLFHFLLGMWMVILNLIVDNLVDMTEKADQLRCNVKEYFDNHVEGKAAGVRLAQKPVTDDSVKLAVKENEQPKENKQPLAEITQEEMEALSAIYDRADKPAAKEKRVPVSLAEKKAEKKKMEYRKSVMAKKKREEMKQQLMQEKDNLVGKQEEERKDETVAVMAAVREKQEEKEKQDWNETAAYLAKELGEDQANSHLIEAVLKEFLV